MAAAAVAAAVAVRADKTTGRLFQCCRGARKRGLATVHAAAVAVVVVVVAAVVAYGGIIVCDNN